MKDEPCPTCHIPLGASLKALRDERDRLIPFVTQHRTKRDEFLKWEKELKDWAARIEESEESLRQRAEKQALEEAALADLMAEARRPKEEFERLTQESDELRLRLEALAVEQQKDAEASQAYLESLRHELASEKKKRKQAAAETASARTEASAIAASYNKISSEFDLIQAKHVRTNALLDTAKEELKNLEAENCQLRAQNQANERKAASLDEQNKKLSAINQLLAKEVAALKRASAAAKGAARIPFQVADLDVLHALSQEVSEQFSPPAGLVSLGSGPFPELDFDQYLEDLGITPYVDGCPWIIVGREGWSEEALNELIDDESFDEIRVFSQELFIAGILTTHDPFSLPLDILMKFAEGHPALEYLIAQGFEWPEINSEEDYGEPSLGIFGGVDESPLTLMGYHVGITRGLSAKDRRDILKSAYQEEIPHVGDDDYMEEWGLPGRSKRLWRIAHHLKREADKRRTIREMRYAVEHWAADSKWLKEQFYTRRMQFTWPDF